MAGKNGNSTFKRITNNDIYDEIKLLHGSVEKIGERVTNCEGKSKEANTKADAVIAVGVTISLAVIIWVLTGSG